VEIVVGAGDAVTPAPTNALRYGRLIRDANVVILPGPVGHYTFLDECTEHGKAILPICRDHQDVDRAAIRCAQVLQSPARWEVTRPASCDE
jgi:hypothetical protein